MVGDESRSHGLDFQDLSKSVEVRCASSDCKNTVCKRPASERYPTNVRLCSTVNRYRHLVARPSSNAAKRC